MPPTDATASDRGRAALLQRPQVGAVVDPVRRDRVAVPVPGEEHRVAARRSAPNSSADDGSP